jgi:YfiH family protein
MSYSIVRIGDWSYLTIKDHSPTFFTYGFFTKESPDLYNPQHSESFLKSFSIKRFVMMKQEHGDRINFVKDGENPASGDALVITEKNAAGIVKSADCVPIIILDKGAKVAAIIHAGYKGTLKRIVEKVVNVMKEVGSKPDQMEAILGPSIGVCCYNIGEEVYSLFKKEFGDEHLFTFIDGKTYLDLKRANLSMLNRLGLGKVHSIDLCTYCHKETFYSYRRGDKEKRQISFVFIRDKK